MEEEVKKEERLTYEQLVQVANTLQHKLIEAESKLKSIDFATVRLNFLFKVLEVKESFSASFIEKCTKEVEELMTIEEEPEK